MLLSASRSQLLVVDIQERLMPAVQEGERVVRNTNLLIAAAQRLGVPIVVTEQYPKGLGPTVAAVAERLPNDATVLPKVAFSGAADDEIAATVAAGREAGREQIVMCGAEAHVCVLQTALGFRQAGYEVYVASDAVASRSPHSVQAACARLLHAGCSWITTEMAVFEWMERAGTDDFRALSALIKSPEAVP